MAVIATKKTVGMNERVPRFPSFCKAITKSDADTYDNPIYVYVGTTGDVSIIPWDDQAGAAVMFKNVPAGSVVPCAAYKVLAATTAQDLVAIS